MTSKHIPMYTCQQTKNGSTTNLNSFKSKNSQPTPAKTSSGSSSSILKHLNINQNVKTDEFSIKNSRIKFDEQGFICISYRSLNHRIELMKTQLIKHSKSGFCHLTTSAASYAATSTVIPISAKNGELIKEFPKCQKLKGYVKLTTNFGDSNAELHCDLVPAICENFLILIKTGYLNNTVFYHSIKNYAIKGGDFHETNTKNNTLFSAYTSEKFTNRLSHDERGVISMVEKGSDVGSFQFCIIFKSAHNFNNKRIVFARIVGGFDSLCIIEKVPTYTNEQPLQEIKIIETKIFA